MKNEIPMPWNRIEMARKKIIRFESRKQREKKKINESEAKRNRRKYSKKYERFMECWSLKKEKLWKIFREGIEINIDFQ